METQTKRDPRKVLTEGGATGHAHVTDVGIVEEINGLKVLTTPTEATLTHEEHGKIKLPAGEWDISIVQEVDHLTEEVRDVLD